MPSEFLGRVAWIDYANTSSHKGAYMKLKKYLFLCIFSGEMLEGASAIKKSIAIIETTLCARSAEGTMLLLDPSWIQESNYVANLVRENPALGSDNMPVMMPLGFAQLEELNGYLISIKDGTTKQFKKNLMRNISGSDRTMTLMHSKVRELHELFKATKQMELKKLQPLVLAAFLFLLKTDAVLNAFAVNPMLMKELDLPSEVGQSLVKLVSDEDQELLRAQLCITYTCQKQPTYASLSEDGTLAGVAGLYKNNTSFIEVFNTMDGEPVGNKVVDYKIKGIEFCHGNQLISWGKTTIDLWDTFTHTKNTPHGWEELLKETKKIWGIALSKNKKNLAVVLDDRVLVLAIPHAHSDESSEENSDDSSEEIKPKILTAPAMHKRENKKNSYSRIIFGNNDQTLIEIRPGGDLIFYRWEKEKVIAFKKGSGNEVARFYTNGSKVIIITQAHEVRVWDCQQDAVEPQNEGKLPNTAREHISNDQFIEFEKHHTKVFCDTGSTEFMDKLVFLTGSLVPASITVSGGVPGLQRTGGSNEKLQMLALPPHLTLQGACASPQGKVFLGITTQGFVKVWHVNNPAIAAFLSSSMPLAQALLIQHLANAYKTPSTHLSDFLKAEHLRIIFETCETTFQKLISTMIQRQQSGVEDIVPPSPRGQKRDIQNASSSSSASTSDTIPKASLLSRIKLARSSSSPAANTSPQSSPQHSPRSAKQAIIAALRLPQTSLARNEGDSPRRRSSHDATSALTPRAAQLLKRTQSQLRGSLRLEMREKESSIKTLSGSPREPLSERGAQSSQSSEMKAFDSDLPESLTPQEVAASTIVQAVAPEPSLLPRGFSQSSTLRRGTVQISVQNSPDVATQVVDVNPESDESESSQYHNAEEVSIGSTTLDAYSSARELFNVGSYEKAYTCFLDIYKKSGSKLYKALSAHFLGEMTLRGRGALINPPLAFTYFEKAVKQNVDKALQGESFARLGEMYYYGYGVKHSLMNALYNLGQLVTQKAVSLPGAGSEDTQIVNRSNEEAPFRSRISAHFHVYRAKSRELNMPVKSLCDEALRLCDEAIAAKSSDASFAWLYKGRLLIAQAKVSESYENSNKAWRCLLKAAESTDESIKTEALYRLGKLSLAHFKSSTQAKEYFEKVLKSNETTWIRAAAELQLGNLGHFEAAPNKTTSYSAAIAHYKEAIEQPYNLWAQAEAAYQMARIYERLEDQPKAWEQVFFYDNMAIAVGEVLGIHHVDAHFSLARQYFRGTPDLPVDLHEAYKHFMTVIHESHNPSQLEEAHNRVKVLMKQASTK